SVDEKKVRLTVNCVTQGASIGFRVKPNNEDSKSPWTIYDGPVALQATSAIEVVAHRIGFKPSKPVVVQSDRK
ncbi:MAG: sulfatase, partial [bacterium]